MVNKIKLSEPMVRAMLQDTKEAPEGTALGYGMTVGTLLALRDRGLTRMVMIANGDFADYAGDYPDVQNRYEILTDRGRFLRAYLSGGTARSWNVETLDAQVQAWLLAQRPVCGDVNPHSDRITCKRPQGHPGNHRPTVGYIGSSAEWPTPVQPEPAVCGQMLDNSKVLFENITRDVTCRREAGHRGLHRETIAIHPDTYKWGDDACVPIHAPSPESAEPVFTVKLYYAAGAFEAPTGPESLCRAVFEEALSNERVIAAELCGPDKRVLEAFGRTA